MALCHDNLKFAPLKRTADPTAQHLGRTTSLGSPTTVRRVTMHAVTFAKPHSLASPARPRDVGRVQRRVMMTPVSATASSNRTDDGAVTESEDVEVKGVALGVARRGLMANVARVGTVLSYGAVLAGCAHTAYVAASRQQRREE